MNIFYFNSEFFENLLWGWNVKSASIPIFNLYSDANQLFHQLKMWKYVETKIIFIFQAIITSKLLSLCLITFLTNLNCCQLENVLKDAAFKFVFLSLTQDCFLIICQLNHNRMMARLFHVITLISSLSSSLGIEEAVPGQFPYIVSLKVRTVVWTSFAGTWKVWWCSCLQR